MAPEAKTAGKAGSPHKEDTPEVKGPQSVLSEREKEVILHSIMTVKGFPAGLGIDSALAADRLGFKNRASLTNAWGIIKKKLAEWEKADRRERGLPSDDDEAAEAATNPAAADSGDDDDDTAGGGAKPTPKKRARTGTKSTGGGTPRSAPRGGRASATSTPRKKAGGAGGKKGTPSKGTPAGKNASLLDYFSPTGSSPAGKAQEKDKEGEEEEGKVVGGGGVDADDDMFVSGEV